MPISLGDLKKATRHCTVAYGDNTIDVTYRPSAMTPAVQSKMRAIANDDEADVSDEVVALFCNLITGWDIVDGDKPVPVKPEVVVELPYQLITTIFQAVNSDTGPNVRKPGA